MKKLNIIILSTLMLTLLNHLKCQNETVGSWVVTSSYGNQITNNEEIEQGFMNYRMSFPYNGAPTLELLSSDQNIQENHYDFAFTIGSYSPCSGSLGLYLTDNYYYMPNQSELNIWDEKIAPTGVLLSKGDSKYQFLYSAEINPSGNFSAHVIDLIVDGNQIIYEANGFPFDESINEGTGATSFTVSNIINEEQYLFIVTGTPNQDYTNVLGLQKYLITENGFEYDETLISDSPNNNFGIYDYAGYNLEMQDKNEIDSPVIAWITTPLSTVVNQKIFIYDEDNAQGDHYFLDLSNLGSSGSGRIGGIEFSPFPNETDFMFVSTENLGLIKINWHTGALVHQFTPTNIDFSHTFVQTAPNGKVYAVSNDGKRFCEIGANNAFNSSAFNYPVNIPTAPSSHIDYKTLSTNSLDIKYYTLPDNDKTMPPSFSDLLIIDGQSFQNIESLSDMTWNSNDNFPNNTILFEHGFRLTGGVTLTINDMNLEFNQLNDAKVIIEPGCKLIVNGSILTYHHCYDPGKWAGIEVWGDPSHNQEPIAGGSYYQGYLEIHNSTIEHAETAIALRKDGIWDQYGGGIVKANNVNFSNNAKSVHFAPFKNMFTRTVGNQTLIFEKVNASEFILCDFIVDENYIGDSQFFKHADIVQVHRIPFLGCNFSVENTPYASTYNSAIALYSAGVNVDKYDAQTPSTFTGFYCGVVSNNDFDKTYYSMVRNSEFVNNSVGIRNTQINNFKIIDNNFYIGENNGGKGVCGWAPGYGVDIREASSYIIENNTFIPYQGNTGDNYGVRLYESATEYTEVYNNEYDNLTIANLSEGLNTFGGDDDEGVAYLCNDHDGSFIDILITGDVEEEIEIHRDNGSEYYASGNTFSPNATMHIQNDGQEIINFYCKGIQTPDHTRCTPIYIDLDSAASLNTCPDHYGGSGGGIGLDPIGRQAKEDEFNDAKLNYNAVESLYEGLTDGGDTEGTELTIAAAQPGDTWELRANLLGMSPYLSKDVLIEAADKTDVLPESVLFEILSANPDELQKSDLLDYLENKEQPLPEYMINILQHMATGSSAKTVLLREMRSYKRAKVKAASEIIHSILIEEELNQEDLRTWLANLESYNGDIQIISSFISQGDISSAQALMDILPELYDLNGDALTEHNEWADLMNMQLNWQAEGRSQTDLTEAELVTLYSLADNGSTKAKYQARGILEHFYGENYIDCCTPPDGNKSTVADFSKNDLAKAMGLSMEAHPNPAKEYTEVSYTLPFGVDHAILSVYDASGRLVENKQLISSINKVAYNTSNLPSGSYTIEIKSNDYSYSIKLIVQ